MIDIPLNEDDVAAAFVGARVASEFVPNVSYLVKETLGAGGMAVAHLALRQAPDGEAPVVLKVLRPSSVLGLGNAASVMVRKESVALGRLNERVPSTSFVVRLIETGTFAAQRGGQPIQLPWLALEYVHGGLEGTTLEERVKHSIKHTGAAFDPGRAAHLLDCLSSGLEAVHGVGVVHRDLTPRNVLCCGFGEEEIFKIADFGIARPTGVAVTFGGLMVGTPGYAPPEQAGLDRTRIGPWSDVFALSASLYFALTGEEYFQVDSPEQAIGVVVADRRRSLVEARYLSPDLRGRETAWRAIDAVFARATSVRPEERPHSASALAALLVPWLRPDSRRTRTAQVRLQNAFDDEDEQTVVASWLWTVRHRPGDDRIVRSVAWDGDGRCLVATTRGLGFWDGTAWNEAPTAGLPDPSGVRFVRRVAAGEWLVGGNGAMLASYSTKGVGQVVAGPDPRYHFTHASGDFEDLAVVVSETSDGEVFLYALSSRRWLRPLPLEEAAVVTGLARVGDDRWLLVGRLKSGKGAAWLYRPLDFRTEPVDVADTRAFLASAGNAERGLGIGVGTDGSVVWLDGSKISIERIRGAGDLSAAALDASGRRWCATAGRLFLRSVGQSGAWSEIWHETRWTAPLVSLFADVGLVVAVSADGGVLEGRATAHR
jgi:serine/threonine protein kinase